MAGEIQEPLNLSLLENSIHSGSVSFGRFEKESLSWEKRSSFSRNVYLEEAEMFSKPGSVTQMRAHFEAHFNKKGIRFPSFVESQTCGEAERDKSFQFGDSCLSYDDDILVNCDDKHTSLSAALEKTEIGSATRSTKNVEKKASPYVAATKTSTKMHTKTKIDSQREKESKPKRTVKSVASKLFRTNERAEMRKEEMVESVARKSLNVKATPMPKIARPTSTGIGKESDEHSSKACCDRSMANGKSKSKLNSYKHKRLNEILPIMSSDKTTRNNVNTRRLAVRHSAVEVAM